MAFTAIALACAPACGGGDDTATGGDAGSSGTSGTSGGFGTLDGSSGSSGTSGTSGGDASLDPDAACASTVVGANRSAANLLFIVDRSGSMNCNPPPMTDSAFCETHPVAAAPGSPTKWSITRDALKTAIAAMPSTNNAAITYFNVDNDCAAQTTPNVPLGPIDSAQIALINSSLDNVQPQGFTPIVGGVTLGYQYLNTNTFTGARFIVLITDGNETCAPGQVNDFINTTVINAALVGIKTFVIGAPGSEGTRAVLSQIAFNGRTAKSPTCVHAVGPANAGDCHFDLTSSGTNLATELNAALTSISKQALNCEFDVPSAAPGQTVDLSRVNVIYTPSGGGAPQTLSQDSAAACSAANGWQYSADHTKVELCGSVCNLVKNDPGATIQIQLGCTTQAIVH